MEKTATLDRESVIRELTQGIELATEVKRHLCPSASSREACAFLVEKIVSCYDNALAILRYMDLLEHGDPLSLIEGSQRSEASDQGFKDHVCKESKDASKKRKIQPRWDEQDTGFDDGYYWRKYGQKDIFGANHPRAYYRCTHRHTQGCLATKQVQRADEDPSILKVHYRGKHSCVQERLKKSRGNANVLMGREESQENQRVESGNAGYVVGTRCSPPFLSPAMSDSYLSMSEFELDELVGQSSLLMDTSFSLGDLDLLIDQVDLDSHSYADCL